MGVEEGKEHEEAISRARSSRVIERTKNKTSFWFLLIGSIVFI